jgi:hypothetical protein
MMQSEQGMAENDKVVIHGTREDGSKLRPGDWVERISSTLASFSADRRLRYHASVKPCIIEGQKCLVVARCLAQADPTTYQFIMAFAESNQLRVQMDRRQGARALTCPAPAA